VPFLPNYKIANSFFITFSDSPVAEKQARDLSSCAAHCVALYGANPAAAVCLYKCTFGRKIEGKMDITMEPAGGVRQARGVTECINKCANDHPTPFEMSLFVMCREVCKRKGRKTDELEDFSIPSIYPSALTHNQHITPGPFSTCVHLCMLTENLNSTFCAHNFSAASVAVSKARASWACVVRCGPYLMSPACVKTCEGGRSLEETPEKMPTVAVRAAGSVQECISNRCTIFMLTPAYFPCVRNCQSKGRKTDDLEDFSNFFSAPAQPISPGQFLQHFSTL
jgi:hypothetical protein